MKKLIDAIGVIVMGIIGVFLAWLALEVASSMFIHVFTEEPTVIGGIERNIIDYFYHSGLSASSANFWGAVVSWLLAIYMLGMAFFCGLGMVVGTIRYFLNDL
jgi:hypothetical protein